MVFFTLFLLFVFPFLQAGPLDNWVSFLTWMVFICKELPVCEQLEASLSSRYICR